MRTTSAVITIEAVRLPIASIKCLRSVILQGRRQHSKAAGERTSKHSSMPLLLIRSMTLTILRLRNPLGGNILVGYNPVELYVRDFVELAVFVFSIECGSIN